MTNQQVVDLVIADPLVRQRQSKLVNGVMVEPSAASLTGVAGAELQNEINSLLDRESIRRSLLERIYELTLSGGTDADQGTYYEMPSYVASIVDVTIGTGHRPLRKFKSIVEFNQWWYSHIGEQATTETAEGWVQWGRSSDGDIQFLISPGVGDDTTAYVHYVRKVTQPVQIGILPDDVHDLVVLGVKNRMTGGLLQGSYEERLTDVERRLNPMIGGADKMPHDQDFANFCWNQSMESAGPLTSDNPLFVSRRQ